MQTCRRHPNTGPFMATCPGCAQELHDLQTRNQAHATARAALNLIGMTNAKILTVHATETTLTIATHNPTSLTSQYTVDVFRLPTPAETDPDLADDYRLTPDQWLLIWQAGHDYADTLPAMLTEARTHLLTHDLITDDTPTTAYPTPHTTPEPVIRIASLPTMPVLPPTQTAADRNAHTASNAFWDHAENCPTCWSVAAEAKPGTHCRTGNRLTQTAADTAHIAEDFAALDHWYRRGGRENHLANDWIAT